jgi:hypothetical protein
MALGNIAVMRLAYNGSARRECPQGKREGLLHFLGP